LFSFIPGISEKNRGIKIVDIKYRADFVKRLLARKDRRTATRRELEIYSGAETDKDLYEVVQVLIADGAIKPYTKKIKTNGNPFYPVADKYHVLARPDFSDIDPEIDLLHPRMLKNGYLQKHKEKYRENKEDLNRLSSYLYRCDCSGRRIYREKVSRKSRSFEIFGREKVLENKREGNEEGILSLTKALGLDEEALRYYNTPSSNFDNYIPERKENMRLLLCENEDIFYDIRRLMFRSERRCFFGERVDGVLYRGGNKATAREALTSFSEFMELENASYLYCGDIDRAGFRIYESLLRNNESLRIDLFTQCYVKMLDLADQLCSIEESKDGREIEYDFAEILSVFDPCDVSRINHHLEQNHLIPQEIINYIVLDENSL